MKVVPLQPKTLEPNPEIVAELEALLGHAKSGRIGAFGYVAYYANDGEFGVALIGTTPLWSTVGHIEALKSMVMEGGDE